MRARVRYGDPDELLDDLRGHFERGGFFLRVPPPEGLVLYSAVTLEVVFGEARAELAGEVIQAQAGVGVAIGVRDLSPLEPLVEQARARTGGGGAPARHEILEDEPPGEGRGEPPEVGARHAAAPARPRGPTRAEKIRMARYGDRGDRDAILRDTDRSLQRFLLTNPGLTLGEVKAMAEQPVTLPQTLKAIAERREWAGRPEIAMAIVRNPRTPVPVAIRLLPKVNKGELRALVRAGHLRTAILNAARKQV